MRVLAGCLLFILCEVTFAESTVSLFFGQETEALDQYWLGAEYATNLGKRLYAGVDYATALSSETVVDHRVALTAGVRLNSEQRWVVMPLATVEWRANSQQFGAALGGGVEWHSGGLLGTYSEIRWQPWQAEVRYRIGFRIWPARMSALDNRVSRADPMGAVYQGGQPTRIVQQPANKEPEAQPVQRNVSSQTGVSGTGRNGGFASGYYLQLGVFQTDNALNAMQQNSVLQSYRADLKTQYDPELNAIRLVIGAYSITEAQAIKTELQAQGMETILKFYP